MMWTMALALQAAVTVPRCPLDAPYDPRNPFAQILAGKAPASIVAETRDMIALVPIAWERPGHVLVIPRRAVRNRFFLGVLPSRRGRRETTSFRAETAAI